MKNQNRREFLKVGALGVSAITLLKTVKAENVNSFQQNTDLGAFRLVLVFGSVWESRIKKCKCDVGNSRCSPGRDSHGAMDPCVKHAVP